MTERSNWTQIVPPDSLAEMPTPGSVYRHWKLEETVFWGTVQCRHTYIYSSFNLYSMHLHISFSLSLCCRSNLNEGGRPAISAYWSDYTQTQLGAMMATVPHCHRQPIFIVSSFNLYSMHLHLSFSLSLCCRSNLNEGGRPAISAYWSDYTQTQLGAMMATVPHCHRQPIFIEQSEAILAGPREATHLPT